MRQIQRTACGETAGHGSANGRGAGRGSPRRAADSSDEIRKGASGNDGYSMTSYSLGRATLRPGRGRQRRCRRRMRTTNRRRRACRVGDVPVFATLLRKTGQVRRSAAEEPAGPGEPKWAVIGIRAARRRNRASGPWLECAQQLVRAAEAVSDRRPAACDGRMPVTVSLRGHGHRHDRVCESRPRGCLAAQSSGPSGRTCRTLRYAWDGPGCTSRGTGSARSIQNLTARKL